MTEPITQPEALRLADALGLYYTHLTAVPDINREAAAELRRLHAENERLRALLTRYRNETPLGHQPHMVAHEVDAALKETK